MKEIGLLIDSGAFSAWTQGQGKEINLDDYIEFCLQYIDIADAVVNLDVIPGRPYKKITPDEYEKSAEQGWRNYEKMLAAGISKEKLIHVFHQGEAFKWLQRMVKEIPYIGLSPANDKTPEQKIAWLDQCMEYVTDENGIPLVKFHGFAVTSLEMMLRYPWYSVDSTTWTVNARLGRVFVPRLIQGKWVYDEKFWIIAISSRSPERKEAGKHFDTLPPSIRKIAMRYFEEMGFPLGKSRFEKVPQTYQLKDNELWAEKKPSDPHEKRLIEIIEEPGLCNSCKLRDDANFMFFQNVEKALPRWPRPFKAKKKTLKGFTL